MSAKKADYFSIAKKRKKWFKSNRSQNNTTSSRKSNASRRKAKFAFAFVLVPWKYDFDGFYIKLTAWILQFGYQIKRSLSYYIRGSDLISKALR